MRMRLLGLVVVVPLLLAGCGDVGSPRADRAHGEPSTYASRCTPATGGGPPAARADLDGDGRPERVDLLSAQPCPGGPLLTASIGDMPVGVELADDLPVGPGGVAAVNVPGRRGAVLLVQQQHPRGGFQAHLYGFAGGHLAELTVGGKPVFPFVATDVLTDPISARCTDGGFEVLHGRRHQPVGIVPAWDVFRTTYAVDGNTVRPGPTAEVADNVLEKDFATTYADLVRHAMFENCRVAG